MFVPYSTCEPSSTSMPYSRPNTFVGDIILVTSSDDDTEDENPPPLAHLPLVGSIEHELALTPLLPRWVCTRQEAVGDLASDPIDQCFTCS